MTATRFLRSSSAERLRRPCALCLGVVLLAAGATVLVDCGHRAPRNGWDERWGPPVPHEKFPADCGLCHQPKRWDLLREDFEFDHLKETGYRLEGVHQQAACLLCHNDRAPLEPYMERGCRGCHVDPHSGANGPDCRRCHRPIDWRPVGLVAEHARTRFPLYGEHALTDCEACHEEASLGEFRGAPTNCATCHGEDAERVAEPDHIAGGLTRGCENCHGPAGWDRGGFDHDSFPLLGGHEGVPCTRCHGAGSVRAVSDRCFNCHESNYRRAPRHVASGYSTDCTECHSIVAWKP